ncbi:hypothetical protein BDF22DRAFT_107864 [Syncephalis plumigaleata]|nr:hypothetical protein BDF22DRAFT_107864 [Syncephalis plumigaleata]
MMSDDIEENNWSITSMRTSKPKKQKQKKLSKLERKQERKEKLISQRAINLREVNRTIQEFIMDPTLLSTPLPPMDKLARRMVHQLALQYNVNSKSTGSGSKRYTILSKKRTSQLPETNRVVNAIIRQYDNMTNYVNPHQSKLKKQNKERGKSSSLPSSSSNTGSKSAKLRPGTVVGSNVPALSASNLGHQLLAKMG